jgi:hypothetical protein
LPHGFGKWTSEWSEGEVLSGYWENGYPIGPFKSREYRTGYSFANLRIGFVTTVATGFHAESFERSERRYGVASIECSSSGKFFSDLPNVNLVYDPYTLKESSLKECLQYIVHISDFPESKEALIREKLVIEYVPTKGFTINGFTPINKSAKRNIQMFCTLEGNVSLENNADAYSNELGRSGFYIQGWERNSTLTEALVYIPGFNCSVHDGIEALGQMLTLGQMPARVKPFVFGWPGGSLLHYSKAKKVAKSAITRGDLIRFIRELIDIGITKIHIVCHSMGARIVANAAAEFSTVFHHFEETLTEPFSEANYTLKTSKKLDTIASTNNHIRNPECVADFIPNIASEFAELASVTFLNPDYPLEEFRSIVFPLIRAHCSLITMYGSNQDIALLSAQYLFQFNYIVGCSVNKLVDSDCIPYDMDVIDTSELDMNIHAAKHSYFNLNKYVIDDLTEIISTGKRACERDKNLLRIRSNVYGFLTAPSYIVN